MVLANPTHMALKPHTCTPNAGCAHTHTRTHTHTCTPNAGLMPIRCWCMPTCQHAQALAHQTAPFHTFQKGQG